MTLADQAPETDGSTRTSPLTRATARQMEHLRAEIGRLEAASAARETQTAREIAILL
jgi:hypothetical protein